MQTFVYQARDLKGQLIKAEVEAGSVSEAAKLLKAKDLFPLDITPRKAANQLSLEAFNRISTKDKVLFTRQLATLVKAGLPLTQALHILQNQLDNPKMKRMVQKVSATVEGGSTLSKALSDYPSLFNTIYIAMVEAGEASGTLDETLIRLANQEEKNAAINSKIRSAFTYPVVVLAVLIGVMVLMVNLVIPQVAKMYQDLNHPLPFLTNMLLGIAHTFNKFWYLFILVFIGIAYAIRVYLKSPDGRSKFDAFKLKMPIFSSLIKRLYMARFARTLGSLVATGVPVLQALGITAKAINNVHIEKAINEVAVKVKGGIAMSQPIIENPMFLPLVGQMIGVGEQTGTIGDSLNKVAAYYEDEVDEAVKNISTLIEPATMVVLGGMVAFLIAAVLLPIYGLVSSIH